MVARHYRGRLVTEANIRDTRPVGSIELRLDWSIIELPVYWAYDRRRQLPSHSVGF